MISCIEKSLFLYRKKPQYHYLLQPDYHRAGRQLSASNHSGRAITHLTWLSSQTEAGAPFAAATSAPHSRSMQAITSTVSACWRSSALGSARRDNTIVAATSPSWWRSRWIMGRIGWWVVRACLLRRARSKGGGLVKRATTGRTATPISPSPTGSFLYTSNGIGGIFDTRKGNFRYKISLYIIIYLDYIIVYHVYHDHVSHISCPSSTHDISICSWYKMHDMIYDDITRLLENMIPTWYHKK